MTKQTIIAMMLALGAILNVQEIKKNHIFGELGGQGLLYSINYERLLLRGLAVRCGISYWSLGIGDNEPDKYFGLPVLATHTFGSNRNRIETGIGAIYQVARFAGLDPKIGISPTATIGYKYVSDTGLVFRIVFTPLYLSWEKRFLPMFGFSVGGEF